MAGIGKEIQLRPVQLKPPSQRGPVLSSPSSSMRMPETTINNYGGTSKPLENGKPQDETKSGLLTAFEKIGKKDVSEIAGKRKNNTIRSQNLNEALNSASKSISEAKSLQDVNATLDILLSDLANAKNEEMKAEIQIKIAEEEKKRIEIQDRIRNANKDEKKKKDADTTKLQKLLDEIDLELIEDVLGYKVDVTNEDAVRKAKEELDSRIRLAKNTRKAIGLPVDEQEDEKIGLTNTGTLARKALQAKELNVKVEEKPTYNEVLEGLRKNNTKDTDDKIRAKALRVKTVIDDTFEIQQLDNAKREGRLSKVQSEQAEERRKNIETFIGQSAELKPNEEIKNKRSILEELYRRAETLTQKLKVIDDENEELIYEDNPELAELTALLEIREIKETFVKESPLNLRSAVAMSRFELELEQTLRESFNTESIVDEKDFGRKIDKEINRIKHELFPVDLKKSTEAALKGGKATDELYEYTLKRQILESTMQDIARRKYEAMKRYKEFENGETKGITELLQNIQETNNRKDSKRLDNEKVNELLNNNNLFHFITAKGTGVLVLTDAKAMAALSPEIEQFKIEDGKKISLGGLDTDEKLTQWYESLGEDARGQMQMTVRLKNGEEVMVFFVNPKIENNIDTIHASDEEKNSLLDELGILNSENLTQEEREIAIRISHSAFWHEEGHAERSSGDLILTYENYIKKLELELKDGMNQKLREVIEQKIKILKETQGQNIQRMRWTNALEELRGRVYERRATQESMTYRDISLGDIDIYDPEFTSKSSSEKDAKLKIDEQIKKLLYMINFSFDESNQERIINALVSDNMQFISEQTAENIKKFDEDPSLDPDTKIRRKKILIVNTFHKLLSSYELFDTKEDLNLMIERFQKITGLNDENIADGMKNSKALEYTDTADVQIVTENKNFRFRDPATIVINYAKASPMMPNEGLSKGAHEMAPMYAGLGIPILEKIPGVSFADQYIRAKIRHQLWSPRDSKGSKQYTWEEYWNYIQNNPARLAEKAEGDLSDDLIGGLMRLGMLHGKNYDQLTNQNVIDNYDSKSGRIVKAPGAPYDLKDYSKDNQIQLGLVGRVMAGVGKTPIAPIYYPAAWGMAPEKIIGRGPLARTIGAVLFGKSVKGGGAAYKLTYQEPPKYNYRPAYIGDRNTIQLEPDGQPRVELIQYGNMIPTWERNSSGKMEMVMKPYLPVNAILPSIEHHRHALLSNLIGMQAKSGIDSQSLQLMIMNGLPEFNLRGEGGMFLIDINKSKEPIRKTDLKAESRMRENRVTIAKYVDEVKNNLFSGVNDGDPVFNLMGTETDDIDPVTHKVTKSSADKYKDLSVIDRNTIDTDLTSRGISNRELARGLVSETDMENMIAFMRQYRDRGAGATADEGKRTEDHPIVIRHVFRAMQYENGIRKLRKTYLGEDPTLRTTLEAWNTEIQNRIKTENFGLKDRREKHMEIIDDVINSHGGSINITRDSGHTFNLNLDQIKTLFFQYDAENVPVKLVHESDDVLNSPFTVAELEKIAYDSEWNMDKGGPGREEIYIGGGFKLHKTEVQIFERALYYIKVKDIMERGIPADSINIPGQTQFDTITLREEYWNIGPYGDRYGYHPVMVMDPMTGAMIPYKDPASGQEIPDRSNPIKNSEHYLMIIQDQIAAGTLNITDAVNLFNKASKNGIVWTAANFDTEFVKSENFQTIVNACEEDREFMDSLFGERAQLQATFIDERNNIHGLRPEKPAPELMTRFFEQGFVVQEVEENLKRIEEQNRLLFIMRYLMENSRQAIGYSKARSEIFKKRAQYIKYFRWAILGITLGAVVTAPGFIPAALPLSPWIYTAMIGSSYYEAYFLQVYKKYWGAREFQAIEYSNQAYELTQQLEAAIRKFNIPGDEEQEQYASIINKMEKAYEQISEVDDDKKKASSNPVTEFTGNIVGGLLSNFG